MFYDTENESLWGKADVVFTISLGIIKLRIYYKKLVFKETKNRQQLIIQFLLDLAEGDLLSKEEIIHREKVRQLLSHPKEERPNNF